MRADSITPLDRLRTLAAGLAAAALLGALPGCSHADRMKPTLAAFERGAYPAAVKQFEPLYESRSESGKDKLLYQLEAGAIFAAAGELKRSGEALGEADEAMWRYLDSEPDVRISEQALAIATNQTIVTYRGTTYDRILCSTYQALNHLAAGELDRAGVSLRRAYEWQRDAVDKNAKEIEALEEKANDYSRGRGYDSERSLKDPGVKSDLDSAYGPIREMSGYAEFAIPLTSYLQGVQLLARGGTDAAAQATVAFRKVAGMLPEKDRAYAESCAKVAEDASAGGAARPLVHVIIESGMGPMLEEFKVSLPLFIRQVPYVGAAFPVLRLRPDGPSGFTARAAGGSYESALLTDMDAVIAGDFNRRLPAIIALTVASSAGKAVGTYFLQEAALERGKGSAWAVAIAGMAYQLATNSADLRIWSTLPKQVLYAAVPSPRDGMISLDLGDGQRIGPLAVESTGTTIVHVRVPSQGATPAVRTMRFPGRP